MSPTGSSRWCPTPQQVMMLEEMYRSGIRTPNATQIQQITSQLSLHGKIEGKNVFYWFQNHKARDRQKLRKKIAKQLQHQQQLYHHHQFLQYFDSPAFRHLSYDNSASPNLFPQAGIHGVEKNKATMRMYGGDWLMMVDVGPPLSSSSPSPCYSVISRPLLKTLELFPLTPSNLKEDDDSNNTNSSDSLSSVSCKITAANVPLSLA